MPENKKKPGYTTTEFWVTVLVGISPILMIAFNEDVSSSVQVWAVTAAGIVTAIYSIGTKFEKISHVEAASKLDQAAIGSAVEVRQDETASPADTPVVSESQVSTVTDVGIIGHTVDSVGHTVSPAPHQGAE